MNPLVDYQDPLALALLIKANLLQDRPDALVVLTSNPGTVKDHYVALVQRVYADKNDLTSFKGYITYRYKNVKIKSKTAFLPEFSSIEVLNRDFMPYDPPLKTHFHPDKVSVSAPSRFSAAQTAVSAQLPPNAPLSQREDLLFQWIGENALMEVYDRVVKLIDGVI